MNSTPDSRSYLSTPAAGRIAYVTSGFPWSFITQEVESHRTAGWSVLPLISSRPPAQDSLSSLGREWMQRAVYRPSMAALCRGILSELARRPVRFLRTMAWLTSLLFRCPTEWAKALYEFPAACSFAASARRFGAQRIHVHFASRSLNLGLMLGILIDRPVSCTVHAFDIFTRSRNSLRPRLLRCDFIASISEFNRRYLREKCGAEVASLCRIVHCGVDVRTFSPDSRRIESGRLVCVARLVPKKGLSIALDACAILRARGVSFRYDIIGDGPQRAALEQQTRELELTGCVNFLGTRKNDHLRELLEVASLFVLPCIVMENSDRDGIPVAMMEAMACGVPVVSTKVSGIPELIQDGKNGLLVPERDPLALADVLERVLHDETRIVEMGQAARRQIEERFDTIKEAARLRDEICRASEKPYGSYRSLRAID